MPASRSVLAAKMTSKRTISFLGYGKLAVPITMGEDAEVTLVGAASRHDDNHYIIKERQDDSLVKNLFAFYPSFRL
jgi:hypothetical protein